MLAAIANELPCKEKIIVFFLFDFFNSLISIFEAINALLILSGINAKGVTLTIFDLNNLFLKKSFFMLDEIKTISIFF